MFLFGSLFKECLWAGFFVRVGVEQIFRPSNGQGPKSLTVRVAND
jgi:hypothetical protein